VTVHVKSGKESNEQNSIHTSHFLFAAEMIYFEEAFPQIDDIEIKIRETTKGTEEDGGERLYDKSNYPGEFTACSNPRCHNGGLPVSQLLRGMIRRKKDYEEGTKKCHGYEGSPGGQKNNRKCGNDFTYSINICYREPRTRGEL
jgi:hypothetical protein